MHHEKKITAMVPARIGSERLARKNLLTLNGVPVVAYALRAAKSSCVFDRIVLNGDDPIFEPVARAEGVGFYLRPPELGSSEARSDDVVANFMTRFEAPVVAWINAASPLQSGSDIQSVARHFIDHDLDSLITTKSMYLHALYNEAPLNFRLDEKFARTQDLTPIKVLVYSVMMWKTKVFMDAYRADGRAMFCGSFGTVDASPAACNLLKTAEDFAVISALARQNGMAGNTSAVCKIATIS